MAKAGASMIAAQVSSPRQTLVAVAAFFGLLLATLLLGGIFLLANGSMQNEFDTKTLLLDGLQRQPLANVAATGDSDQTATRRAVISAPSETIAASQLQKDILRSLKDAGGTVHSIQAEATTDIVADGLKRLNAQITFDGSVDSLQKVLFALETATPYIVVDSIVLQPASSPAPGDRIGDALRVTLVASSYWK